MFILLDTPNIAYRWHHALLHKSTTFNCRPAVLGVLRQAVELLAQFSQFAPTAAFLFDEGEPLRKQRYSKYKWHHKDDDNRRSVRASLALLRREILPRAGFRNVFSAEGYEADDLIAAVCNRPRQNLIGERLLVVSSDHDLWQLLGEGVTVYDPHLKQVLNHHWLTQTYGVTGPQWAEVIALAGCAGDAVEGIDGVQVKTACKYVLGKLPAHYLAAGNIRDGAAVVARNRELVTLPYPGCPVPSLIYDELSKEQWDAAMMEYEVDQLLGRCPGGK